MSRSDLRPWARWLVDHRLRGVLVLIYVVTIPPAVVAIGAMSAAYAVVEEARKMPSDIRRLLNA